MNQSAGTNCSTLAIPCEDKMFDFLWISGDLREAIQDTLQNYSFQTEHQNINHNKATFLPKR